MGFAWPGTVPIAHWIADGEEVGIPGIDVRAMHTPGHSRGSVTFVTPEGLISGDVLFRGSVGRVDLPGGDWDTLVRTIREELFVHPGDTAVYPGHGPVTTIGHEMASNPFVGARALSRPSPTASDVEHLLHPTALYRDFLASPERVREFFPVDFRDPAAVGAAAAARDYPSDRRARMAAIMQTPGKIARGPRSLRANL